jgi:hypothetical protein
MGIDKEPKEARQMGNGQKFLTKANLKDLPPLYSQEDKGDDATVHVKFFTPWSSWTWYATEFDPEEGLFFGLVDGQEKELGYFSMAELKSARGPAGLLIERDMYFKPCPISEVK